MLAMCSSTPPPRPPVPALYIFVNLCPPLHSWLARVRAVAKVLTRPRRRELLSHARAMSFWSQSSGPSGAGAYNAGASTSFGGSSYNAAPPAHGSPGPWGGPSHAPYGSGAPSGLYGGGPSTPGASTGSPFFVSQPPSHQPAQFGFSSSYMSQPGGFDASGAAPSQQQQPSFFGGGMPMQQAPQQYFASTSKPAPGSPWGQQVRPSRADIH